MSEQVTPGEQINTEASTTENEETSLVGGSAEEITEEQAQDQTPNNESEKVTTEETKEVEVEFENFKVPEGVLLDENVLTEFKTVAKDLKLNQDQAQKLIDLQTKFNQDHSAKLNDQFKAQVNTWKEESITELGANYKQDLVKVAKAMNSFGSPEFRTLLNDTGLGNHKEVVKFFLNIGNRLTEDKMRDANSAGKDKVTKTLQEKHYPNTKS